MKKITNRLDCIFYLFIMDEEPSVTCKDSLQRKIFERFNKVLDFDCDSYAMHSGAYIRSSATLKEEFAGMIPVQVKIIFFYRKTGLVSLLSPVQRERNRPRQRRDPGAAGGYRAGPLLPRNGKRELAGRAL